LYRRSMTGSVAALYKSGLIGLGKVKNLFFSDEIRYQRIWFGLCRGSYLPLDLRHGMRMVLGLYELEVVRYFKEFSQAACCLYDIGARHGYYSLAFSRLAGSARVYAFEPDQHQCAMFREVMARNRPSSKIEAFELFLGQTVNEQQKRETLDHLVFARGFEAPDLLKIDVDGPEFEILRGAGMVLEQCRPRLVVETHSYELEANCKALLEQSGYRVKIVKNNPLLQDHRPTELNRWLVAKPL
jgi:precorrin-6B methylase 2